MPVVPYLRFKSDWWHIGNERDESLDGTCGTVVLDLEGNAVGFFRYLSAQSPGFATGIAASTLTKWDYHVVDM